MRKSVRHPVLVSSVRRSAIIFLSGVTFIGVAGCAERLNDSGVVQLALEASSANSAVQVRDFRFYVHDVELLDRSGRAHPFLLQPDGMWQDERVALVDLVGDGEEDRHSQLRGRIGAQVEGLVGIRFTVGVPFDLNHSEVLKASPPLNRGDLFWSWQAGYKFLRVDLAEQSKEWSFHLGSTGCASASALRPPQSPCAQPNTFTVELKGFNPLEEPVRVELSELIDAMRAPDAGTCTGGYAHDSTCSIAFETTGLNVRTGSCEPGICSGQRLFSVRQ